LSCPSVCTELAAAAAAGFVVHRHLVKDAMGFGVPKRVY
jgi:hypothetical protein